MSSTREERRLRRFFDKRLVPTARRLAERGVRFFPLGPTEDESWYAGPPQGPDFLEREAGDLRQQLEALWRAQEIPELVALAGPLAELAEKLETRHEDSAEVSPFVYVMY